MRHALTDCMLLNKILAEVLIPSHSRPSRVDFSLLPIESIPSNQTCAQTAVPIMSSCKSSQLSNNFSYPFLQSENLLSKGLSSDDLLDILDEVEDILEKDHETDAWLLEGNFDCEASLSLSRAQKNKKVAPSSRNTKQEFSG